MVIKLKDRSYINSNATYIESNRRKNETTIQNEDSQIFIKLGLTIIQTKIYLALSKLGRANVNTISKTAQLDRSEIYRGISGLQKQGLVEKIIGTPNVFISAPMRDGLSILLERKIHEDNEIKTKITELIRKSEKNEDAETLQVEENQFVIVPEKEVARHRWINAGEKAQESLDYIVRWEGFIKGTAGRKEHFEKLLDNGIKIRGIVSEPKDQKAVSNIVDSLKKKGSYDIRYIFECPSAVFSIFDKKEVLLNLVTTSLPTQTPSLWSKNPSLAAIVQDYFELKWRAAGKYNMLKRTKTAVKRAAKLNLDRPIII